MKIGILTMTFNNNYGGMLQAYALMTYLKELGHTPLLINVQLQKKQYYKLPYTVLKRFILKYLFRRKDILWVIPEWIYKKRIHCIEQYTNYFVEKYINPKTNPIYNERQFYKHTKEKCDAYIIGSDQVWRPSMFRYIHHAFFDFIKDDKILLISYAASFGVDYWEFSKEETEKYKKQIQRFKAVSVRENTAVELCLFYFKKEAVQVLDPTLLLKVEDYIRIAHCENETPPRGELLYYFLDINEEIELQIKDISNKLGYKPFNINVKKIERTASVGDRIYPSVTSWIQGFIHAKFVVTDSYHGCVFSILFNKPFIVYSNNRRGTTRIDSLLTSFNLNNRLIVDSGLDYSILEMPYDVDSINSTLNDLREKSKNFLQKNLIS